MILLINTQVQENYGAHDWDGKGKCPQYWKMKGGEDYKVQNVPFLDNLEEAVEMFRGRLCSGVGYREDVVGWEVVPDGFLTEFEQSQLEHEGKIVYPAQSLEYSDLCPSL